jgi:hypothetical protein
MDRLPQFSTTDLAGQTLTNTQIEAMAPAILVLLRGLA